MAPGGAVLDRHRAVAYVGRTRSSRGPAQRARTRGAPAIQSSTHVMPPRRYLRSIPRLCKGTPPRNLSMRHRAVHTRYVCTAVVLLAAGLFDAGASSSTRQDRHRFRGVAGAGLPPRMGLARGDAPAAAETPSPIAECSRRGCLGGARRSVRLCGETASARRPSVSAGSPLAGYAAGTGGRKSEVQKESARTSVTGGVDATR